MESEFKENEAKLEQTPCEGSDSGVEMGSRCYHCKSTALEVDSETDSCQIDSSNGHSPSVYFNGASDGDVNDLVSSTIRQLSVRGGELNGEQCPTSYDAASENGSESSSIDDTKKCTSNCADLSKFGSYCAKGSRRQTTPSSRSRSSPFGSYTSDGLKFVLRTSSVSKCISSANESPSDSSATISANKTKLPIAETKNRGLRSCSVTRTRTPVTSPDELKWPMEGRMSGSKLLPNGSSNGCSSYSDRTTFDTYATLPRRKHRELSETRQSNGTPPRDPSLNRAASLRKKFLENSLMTTSMNASIGSSAASSSKTLPPYVKVKPVKTKIYLEAASQTALTNKDVDEALSSQPFSIYNDMEIQAEAEYRIKKRYEEQMRAINEELKRLKKENSKQRTVIEWLEGELTTAKDEKCSLKNKYASIEEKIYSLLRHKGSCDDVFHQLEREVSASNNVIAKQQDEIAELHQVVCMLKRDLEKSFSAQRTIVEAQKANEVESLELQEFLQAEKVTLTDSLKDMEQELILCRARLTHKEQELTNKQKEYENLEQIRQEKQTLKMYLCNMERRSRELLLQQGSVISSASVALSGLGSRFDELLEQLVTAYSISEDDLLQDECRLKRDDNANKFNRNCSFDESERSITADSSGSAKNLSVAWLKAIRSILFRASSTEKQDCNGGGPLENSSSTSSILDLKTTTNNKNSSTSTVAESSPSNQRNCAVSNFNATEDPFCLYRLDMDSRRNSILSDVYLADENLTFDVGVNDSLENACNVNFLKDYPSRDVSLVEQVIDVDKQVTKALKALLIAGEQSTSNTSDSTSTHSLENTNPFKKQNGVHVPETGNAIAFLRLQQKTVNNLLSVLHQMQDAVDGSKILKKIQNDLEDVDTKCNTFLASVPFDTAV